MFTVPLSLYTSVLCLYVYTEQQNPGSRFPKEDFAHLDSPINRGNASLGARRPRRARLRQTGEIRGGYLVNRRVALASLGKLDGTNRQGARKCSSSEGARTRR